MTTIKLSEVLAPSFREVHHALKAGEANQFVLKGGRGSTKSSFVSVEMILQLIKHPEIHAVVMRKVANTMRTTVFAQYVWAYTSLGLYDKFKATVSPMEIVYKPTGQKIMFFGADDPGKIKSIKVPFGYIGLLHFEELDQFAGPEEVRNIEQSVLRGGEISVEFKSFNPPKTLMNWANKYCLLDKPGQIIHQSDYRTVPPEWLGERFLNDAEYLWSVNPSAYEHEYLGIPNGNGGMVFENVVGQTITDDQIETFDRVLNGVDWGYYPDPWAFDRVHYDAARRTLYIFDELHAHKKGNKETAEMLTDRGLTREDRITADSAEPKSVSDYQKMGLNCRGAQKGPGSVEYSMKWLQSLVSIVIDPKRCPETYREFTSYEYERTKDGEVISGYPDKDNHHIDAVRYATEQVWRRGEPRKETYRPLWM